MVSAFYDPSTIGNPPSSMNHHHITSFLKNKYLLAGSLFLVWMLFFNEKDLISEFKRKEKLQQLQQSEQQLNTTIQQTRQELGQLKTNAQTIEKYAREKYLMKKDNEDLFIFLAKDANK